MSSPVLFVIVVLASIVVILAGLAIAARRSPLTECDDCGGMIDRRNPTAHVCWFARVPVSEETPQ